ncbi:NAD(P)H dehydrogenase (quinone) [Streptomyces tanashiensis]
MTTPVVSIAYHSGYGHTAVLAEAVRDGAADAGATVHLIKVDEIDAEWELLDASDAIVFGSPTYMGTASGAFHQFAEATSKRWFTDAWLDKLAAGFTNSGSKSGDKLHTLQFFQTETGTPVGAARTGRVVFCGGCGAERRWRPICPAFLCWSSLALCRALLIFAVGTGPERQSNGARPNG